jgi:hypothetical protein
MEVGPDSSQGLTILMFHIVLYEPEIPANTGIIETYII